MLLDPGQVHRSLRVLSYFLIFSKNPIGAFYHSNSGISNSVWNVGRFSKNFDKNFGTRDFTSLSMSDGKTPIPSAVGKSENPKGSKIYNLEKTVTELFCNVELHSKNLEAVGFDMDFTLAQYNIAFDLLAFEGAKEKLYKKLGYPEDVLKFEYNTERFRRGLIIDKKRGNVLKIDRHKYVRKVFHGTEELTTKERKAFYSQRVETFTESNYVNIDTIFLLVDALLFSHLVDLRKSHESLQSKSYEDIYADVRQSVDLCHKDGVIKNAVMANPEKYIIYDELLVPMLVQLKKSGKKVFLLTNSLYEYTNRVMDYLVHAGGKYQKIEWKDLFDVVIVGAAKPNFLRNPYLALFQVDEKGSLSNIEDKDLLAKRTEWNNQNKVFQGGYWQDLHNMLGVSFGDKILYVGDHMYADVVRSKRTLGWRTCLIIPELKHELITAKQKEVEDLAESVTKLRRLQYDLDEYIDILRQQLRMNVPGVDMMKLLEAEAKADELKASLRIKTEEHNRKFNPYWGQIFKAGHQDSRFAKQVMDYACLYTSKASNLALVSPDRSFRPIQDFMPHDHHLERDRP